MTCNIAEPRKGEIVYAMTNTSRETEGNAFSDALGELDVLSDSVKEGVVRRLERGLGGIGENGTRNKGTLPRVTKID